MTPQQKLIEPEKTVDDLVEDVRHIVPDHLIRQFQAIFSVFPEHVLRQAYDFALGLVDALKSGESAVDVIKTLMDEADSIGKTMSEEEVSTFEKAARKMVEQGGSPLVVDCDRLISVGEKLPAASLACFPTNIEPLLYVIDRDSPLFKVSLRVYEARQRRELRRRLEARRPGRPHQSQEEFLNNIANAIRKLGGAKPTQAAVARLLDCDASYLRFRRKKLGFKNWKEVLTHIL